MLAEGIDTCLPDNYTACDLHRGLPVGTERDRRDGRRGLVYEAEADQFRCSQGKVISRRSERQHGGQRVTVYRTKSSCEGCPLMAECLTQAKAKPKYVYVTDHAQILQTAQERFREPEHRQRYRQRGPAVETVFAFLRGALGYVGWLLRGSQGVASEASLFKTAYQLRKLHALWAAA